MKQFMGWIGLGMGLSLGGGIIYALYTSESARFLTIFMLGAIVLGGTVLATTLLINRQWTRAIGEQKTTHNHRYQVYQPPAWEAGPVQRPPELLPPPNTMPAWGALNATANVDDEVVA